jgi:hypothetical protein
MTEEDVSSGVGDAGNVAGAAGLGLEAVARAASMTGGASAAADAVLAGGAAAEGLSAGAAAVGVGTAAAGVVGAFATGYWVGTQIDEATGASDALSTAAVDADPELARSAANDWDNAGAEWSNGEYGSAVADGASSVGKFAVGSVEAAGSAIADGAEKAWDEITDIF